MRNLLLATAVAFCFAVPAFAQNAPDDVASQNGGTGGTINLYHDNGQAGSSTAQSGATANAKLKNSGNSKVTNSGNNVANGGTANSRSRATVGNVQSSSQGGNVTNNITSGGTGSGNGSYTTSTWDHAATAYAPSFGSANPCAGSSVAAGGQAGGLFGLTFGSQKFDNACRLEQARGNPAAVAYLCRVDSDIRQAMQDIGEPCPQDRPAPVPVAAIVPDNQKYAFDYCGTRNAGDANQHKECAARPIR